MIDIKDSKVALSALPETGAKQIESVIQGLDAENEALRKSDPAKEIEILESELRTLKHKKVLGTQYADIEKYIRKIKQILAQFHLVLHLIQY